MKHPTTAAASEREDSKLRTHIYIRGLSKMSRDLQHQLISDAAATDLYSHLELLPPTYVETSRKNSAAERLLLDARTDQFEAIICYDLGRLGNGPEEAFDFCNRLLCAGVRIFAVTRGELTSNTLFKAKPLDSETL